MLPKAKSPPSAVEAAPCTGGRRVGLDGRKQQLGLPGAAEGAGVWGLRLGCTGTSGSWGSSIYARFAVCHMRALAQLGLLHRSGFGWSGVLILGSSMIWRMSRSSADTIVPCLVCLVPSLMASRLVVGDQTARALCEVALLLVRSAVPLWAVLT